MIESTTKDSVAVLAMRHGKANALDTELCQALCGALDDAAADGAAAVVLTGAGTMFSAGVDLKRVTAGREGYVAAFLPELRRVFTRLATFELPVVAAVNGHAIAGGFILNDYGWSAAVTRDPPIWAATWIARVTVVTAPGRLFGSRPGGDKPWLVWPACAWPAMPASPLPGASRRRPDRPLHTIMRC